jgi:hypothetical protein
MGTVCAAVLDQVDLPGTGPKRQTQFSPSALVLDRLCVSLVL